jgi:hypothetical protein
MLKRFQMLFVQTIQWRSEHAPLLIHYNTQVSTPTIKQGPPAMLYQLVQWLRLWHEQILLNERKPLPKRYRFVSSIRFERIAHFLKGNHTLPCFFVTVARRGDRRYKPHFVAGGHRERPGVYFPETYSSVCRLCWQKAASSCKKLVSTGLAWHGI